MQPINPLIGKHNNPQSPTQPNLQYIEVLQLASINNTSSRMSKRPAPPPISPKAVAVKKQKLDDGSVETYAPTLASPKIRTASVELPEIQSKEIELSDVESDQVNLPEVETNKTDLQEAESKEVDLPENASNEIDLPEDVSNETELPEADPNETEATKPAATKTTPKTQPKRKAGEGFIAWTPPRALEPLPELQPHWGIIPRRGGYERPSMPQPPARDSDGSIRPPLWEDRKGAARVKRGSRIVDGYDQADHLWLALMDVRPVSAKNQQPRRKVIGYWYPHGMPEDWNDATVLNDANKALQEAIKANSNKEAPYSPAERQILASIFAEDPEISLLDAAELFNERAHPVTGSEEGSYPTGRFTESIQHEFRTYQSVYVKGEVPTASTPKESALNEHYQIWKAEQEQAKIDASNAKKDAKAAAKAEKQAAKEAKAKATAEKKEAREKAKAEKDTSKKTKKPRAQKGEKKMSETAGVTKKKRADKQPYSSKIPFTLEEMLAHADATALMQEAAEEAEKKAAEEAAETDTETAAESTDDQTEDLPQTPGATTKKPRAKNTGKKMSDSAGITKSRSPKRIHDDEKMFALAAEIMEKNAAEKAAKEAAEKLAQEAAELAAEEAAEKVAKETAEKVAKEAAEKAAKAAAKLSVKAAMEANKLAKQAATEATELTTESTDDETPRSGEVLSQSPVVTSPPTEAAEDAAETTQEIALVDDEILSSDEDSPQSPVTSSIRSSRSSFTTITSSGPLTSTSPFTSTGPFLSTSPFTATGPFGQNGTFGSTGSFALNAARFAEIDENYDEEDDEELNEGYDEAFDEEDDEEFNKAYDEEFDEGHEEEFDEGYGEDEEL